ncbi:LADA_0F03532g1_1 [Lachancea dasiensis]|uniref:LADA_0F03532g1_1 n=1 Tax=Lachancea dasiensis TaxID=1072105 RepID=A0A1G4JIS0_9SACH|nr:LADA_0F03532g1_1 [Lachancea dasiensis]
MPLSYERYMNLVFHLNSVVEPVPQEISRKIVFGAVSPVVTVTSNADLDQHVQDCYGMDSLYMLLRHFGDCVSDKDQAESDEEDGEQSHEHNTDQSSLKPTSTQQGRKRTNSLFQRSSSRFLRFTRPLTDLIGTRESHDLLFDYHSLEVFLQHYLSFVEQKTTPKTPHVLLQHSLYHKFFTTAISSTTHLSPYESFNHPIASLLALDISKGQNYETARELLVTFKNMHNHTLHFPSFININDVLPVFLLCYEDNSREQFETCNSLAKMLKKQLFVESILLPCWSVDKNVATRALNQPVMSSLEETMLSMMKNERYSLPLTLVENIYDRITSFLDELLIPFMKRKISFWEETILQPRKSIFPNSKFFRRLMAKNPAPAANNDSATHNSQGLAYFAATSNEFLLRKLADWSFMLSDFKTAYSTYELLSRDFEGYPEYLAPCLEWCAFSVLMGAQSIVTLKMIKSDIDPLIVRALKSYELSANKAKERNAIINSQIIAATNSENSGKASSAEKAHSAGKKPVGKISSQSATALTPHQSAQSYETRCMLMAAELFLSLSDTWTATPYAIKYLETILDDCTIGSLSQIVIWERLAYCYALKVDPRMKSKSSSNDNKGTEVTEKQVDDVEVPNDAESDDDLQPYDHKLEQDCMASMGLTRKRKSTLFRLIAAKKWAKARQWRQASWSYQDVESMYSHLGFAQRDNSILQRLRREIESHES